MPNNIGTLLTSPIRPQSTSDTFPTALANEISGGHHSVSAFSDLALISADRLQIGMFAYVVTEQRAYVYLSSGWTLFSSGSSGGGSFSSLSDVSGAGPLINSSGYFVQISGSNVVFTNLNAQISGSYDSLTLDQTLTGRKTVNITGDNAFTLNSSNINGYSEVTWNIVGIPEFGEYVSQSLVNVTTPWLTGGNGKYWGLYGYDRGSDLITVDASGNFTIGYGKLSIQTLTSALSGNFLTWDNNDNLVDSGISRTVVVSMSAGLQTQITNNSAIDTNQAVQIAGISGNAISIASQIASISGVNNGQAVQIAGISGNIISVASQIASISGVNNGQAVQIAGISGNAISIASQIAGISGNAISIASQIAAISGVNNGQATQIAAISGNAISIASQIAAISGVNNGQAIQIAAISGAIAPFALATVVNITGNTTLSSTNKFAICDASYTTFPSLIVGLPSPTSGVNFFIKKIDSTVKAVQVSGGVNIDNYPSYSIVNENEAINIVADGIKWRIIGHV